jgi:aryl-alcohol dehydrogenase-like predicted oxidoreductase
VERRWLGAAGLEAPVIGVGAPLPEDVVSTALDHGASFVDADIPLGDRRDEAIMAARVTAVDATLGADQVRAALERHGRVELFQIEDCVAWRDHLDLLEPYREAGSVHAIGATMGAPKYFEDLEQVMRSGRIQAIQVPLNPRQREAELAILPLAESLGLGVVVCHTLRGLVRRRVPPQRLAPLREFEVRSWPQALLKWALSDPRVHVAVCRTSRRSHIVEDALGGNAPWFGPAERDYVAELAGAVAV